MKSAYIFILTMAVLSMSAVSTAVAQHRFADHGRREHWDSWRSHDRGHDGHRWRSGSWRHGRHDGRLGWWWVVGGLWYFHPQPVYPYPDPYPDPYLAPYPPSVVVIEPPPVYVQPLPPAPASPPPAQFWYYCEAVGGYYPYVPSCPSGWQTVPATPAVPSGVRP